jgi:delta 1-pyrroline-5-carboxylate dehydrogenase
MSVSLSPPCDHRGIETQACRNCHALATVKPFSIVLLDFRAFAIVTPINDAGRPFGRLHSHFNWRGNVNGISAIQRAERLKSTLSAAPQRLLIDGKCVASLSGETFETLNPATGEVLAHVARGNTADIDLAVDAARRAFEDPAWRRMSAYDRTNLLLRLADLIERDADELAVLECLDNGKPAHLTRLVEVEGSIKTFRYFAGWPTKFGGETLPVSPRGGTQILNYTTREPIGVAGLIVPWNFPLSMASWKVAPALAAGCAVVLKPAEQTPLTALRLGELALEAGFPPGIFNVVTGFGDAGAALVAHPQVDKIAFTGSTEVGKLIVKASAGNLKKVSLELGAHRVPGCRSGSRGRSRRQRHFLQSRPDVYCRLASLRARQLFRSYPGLRLRPG